MLASEFSFFNDMLVITKIVRHCQEKFGAPFGYEEICIQEVHDNC